MVTTGWPRPMRAVQRARLWAITWTASQAALAGKRPEGRWFNPTPYLRSRMAFSISAWRRWSASSSRASPLPVGDAAVIAVGGEEGQLGTGRGFHPLDDEPHRCGVGLTLKGGVAGLRHIGGAVHPVREGVQSASGMASMRLRRLLCWRMVMEKRTSISRQTATRAWA